MRVIIIRYTYSSSLPPCFICWFCLMKICAKKQTIDSKKKKQSNFSLEGYALRHCIPLRSGSPRLNAIEKYTQYNGKSSINGTNHFQDKMYLPRKNVVKG